MRAGEFLDVLLYFLQIRRVQFRNARIGSPCDGRSLGARRGKQGLGLLSVVAQPCFAIPFGAEYPFDRGNNRVAVRVGQLHHDSCSGNRIPHHLDRTILWAGEDMKSLLKINSD